ncbi:MAG: hypothetical protein WC884_04115 [Candidatus Paceibacterota bacterium]
MCWSRFIFLDFIFFSPNLRPFYGATSSAPWIEEGLKFIVVLFLIRIAYLTPSTIPFLGLGFGFMEQLAYFINRNDFTNRKIIIVWVHINHTWAYNGIFILSSTKNKK